MTLIPDYPPAQSPRVQNKVPRFASLRTIVALMLREMSTTYGRSPGGYAWAVLEPAAGIALMTTIFSIGFRSPALGDNFALFYATGILPFFMFNNLTSKLGQALGYSKQLLAYPRVTFVDALLARLLINLITQLLVGYVILAGIMVIFEPHVIMDFNSITRAYFWVAVLAFGIGTINCFLMRRFPVFKHVWSVMTRPLFILSCVFYLFETVPQPYRDYLWYNPLVHVIALMRRGFYPIYDAQFVSEAYVAFVGLTTLVVGLLLLRRDHKTVLER